MKVFLSWSGDTSKEIAVKLKEWLPNVLQYTKPYVSAEDIDSGTRWSQNIAQELEETYYGVILVTKDNIAAPWINFEAGALSKKFDASRVTPLLYNIKPEEISGPLVQFQMVTDSKDGIWNLIKSLNKFAGEFSLDELRIKKVFEVWWPHLEEDFKSINFSEADAEADTTEQKSHLTNNNKVSLNSSEEQIAEILNLLRSQQKQYGASSLSKDKETNKDINSLIGNARLELRDAFDSAWIVMREMEKISNEEEKKEDIAFLRGHAKETISKLEKAAVYLNNSILQ